MTSLVSNQFESAILKGRYLIDRSPYIEKYEKSSEPFLICLRPSGFDKELFLSMLQTYYDISAAAKSEKLFRKLYIGKRTTPLASKFYTLFLDFSLIETSTPSSTEDQYRTSITASIKKFYFQYGNPSDMPSVSSDPSNKPKTLLLNFLQSLTIKPIFIFMNEYDDFQKEILENNSGAGYHIKGTNPIIQPLYHMIQEALLKKLIDRVFVLGIDTRADR
ncbi:AAA family ATPase [bacterium]|nr:AAA family ATPase [bacterium]